MRKGRGRRRLLLMSAPLARTGEWRAGRADRAAALAIKAYRRVSPRLATPRCRFVPTCSAYGLEAVERYGAGRGLRLTAGRLMRCRPGVPYGALDPVP